MPAWAADGIDAFVSKHQGKDMQPGMMAGTSLAGLPKELIMVYRKHVATALSWSKLLTLVLAASTFLVAGTSVAQTQLNGKVDIVGFMNPPPHLTTDAIYDDVAYFGLDYLNATYSDGTTSSNDPILAKCAARNMKAIIRGLPFVKENPGTDADVDSVVATYSSKAGLGGYYVKDEPRGTQTAQYGANYRRFVSQDPAHTFNYGNLFPINAPDFYVYKDLNPIISQTASGWGETVSTTASLTQYFGTWSTMNYIDAVQLWIDHNQWTAGEKLTLTLYDGTTRIASRTLAKEDVDANSFPVFYLQTAVTPSHTYKMVLTHDGGGDGRVGWVVTSTYPSSYPYGNLYVGNTLAGGDLWFKISAPPMSGSTEAAQKWEGTGANVTPSSSFGQTFTVPAGTAYPLRTIELKIDPATWSSSEPLALTVWDSTSRTRVLGRATLKGSNNGYYPRFGFYLPLTAGSTYYMELTHLGGGDNSVGWVIYSNGDVNPSTTGYRANVAQSWDLYYRAFFGPNMYDQYVNNWIADANPGAVVFDNYPFPLSGQRPDYFLNIALIRGRAMANSKPWHGYMQAARWSDFGLPSESQMRWNMYTQLAAGATGLHYFMYWSIGANSGTTFTDGIIQNNGARGPRFLFARGLNGEAHQLGKALGVAASTGVYFSGPVVDGLSQQTSTPLVRASSTTNAWIYGYFRLPDGRKLVMIVNNNWNSTGTQTDTFTWNPRPASLSEVSKTNGSLVPVSGCNSTSCAISLTIAPGDGRLFIW